MMKIFFITGKGGVGKSAVAAARALQLARQNKRTLLVELGDQSFYKDYFNLPQVQYQPCPVTIGDTTFDVAQWDGQAALREYAIYLLKMESLYNLLFENPISRALIRVAPGLPELSILGKITSGPRKVGPPVPYDCIVVDSYASGHFLALLKAPLGMGQAIRVGPMGDQVRTIETVLRDPQICSYEVVMIPEELPVVEGLELAQKIKDCVGLTPKLILNHTIKFPATLPPAPEELQEFEADLQKIQKRQLELQTQLESSQMPLQELPWVFQHQSRAVVASLSEKLNP